MDSPTTKPVISDGVQTVKDPEEEAGAYVWHEMKCRFCKMTVKRLKTE